MFSSIFSNQLHSPYFLNSALNNLDKYIALNNFGFSAEQVISTITDGYICNLDVELTKEEHVEAALQLIPLNCPRLKLASTDPEFIYEVLSCPYLFLDGLFPAPIVDTLLRIERGDTFFNIKESITRLRTSLKIKHAVAKTLIARICGMKTGNELQRFENELESNMRVWVTFASKVNIPRIFFADFLDKAYEILPEFTEYTSVNTRYENDQIVAMLSVKYPSHFHYFTQITEELDSDNEISKYYQHLVQYYTGDFIDEIDDAFYKRLYNFAFANPVETQKSLAMRKIILRSIFCECLTGSLTSTLLSVYRNILGRVRDDNISTDEIEYKFNKYLLAGSALYLGDGHKKYLEERMLSIGNTYKPSLENDPILSILKDFFG